MQFFRDFFFACFFAFLYGYMGLVCRPIPSRWLVEWGDGV